MNKKKLISIFVASFVFVVVILGASIMVYVSLDSNTTNTALLTELIQNVEAKK